MRRQSLLLLVLLSFLGSYCCAQHWSPLQFKFNSNYVYYIQDTAAKDMYITGGFSYVNGVSANLVKWDGDTGISYLNITGGNGAINDIATYDGKLFVNIGGFINRKDDSGWYRTTTNYQDAGGLARLGGRLLTAMLITDKFTGKESNHLEVWDGAMWKDTLSFDTLWPGEPGWNIHSIAWYKDELYVGGNFNSPQRPDVCEILRFDGTKWKGVSGGLPNNGLGYVNQLIVWKGDLYACGSFQEKYGAPGNSIARWDGSAWHRLGDGLWHVDELGAYGTTVHNDELYVVGKFSHAGGLYADGLAKWDGKKWCVVNDEFDGSWRPYQVQSYKGKLYISGGWYSINGDTAFNHLAVWKGGAFGDTCSVPLGVSPLISSPADIQLYPNPATERLFIKNTAVISATIYDIQGRLIYRGNYVPSRGIDVHEFAPGTYLVYLETPQHVRVLRFIR